MARMLREVSGEKLWAQLVVGITIHCQICNEMKSSATEASSCTVGHLKFLGKKLLKIHWNQRVICLPQLVRGYLSLQRENGKWYMDHGAWNITFLLVETRAANANLSWLQPVTSLQHPMHNCTDYSQGVESPTTQESHHWCECASLLISSTNSTGKRSKWPKQKTPCTIWSFLLLANKLAKQLLFTFCKSKWQEYGNEILNMNRKGCFNCFTACSDCV